MELYKHLEAVKDRQSFLSFVEALIQDRTQAVEAERLQAGSSSGVDAGGWENTTIESYLAAAVAWAKDADVDSMTGLSDEPSWKSFATFLYVGKLYE